MISVTHFAFENIAISKVHAAQDGGDQVGEGQGEWCYVLMCFLSHFSIEKQLSQTLKVEAVDQPIFFSKTLTTGWFS